MVNFFTILTYSNTIIITTHYFSTTAVAFIARVRTTFTNIQTITTTFTNLFGVSLVAHNDHKSNDYVNLFQFFEIQNDNARPQFENYHKSK